MLVIGCGNAWRGDDAAGLLAARRLREMGIDAREHDGEPFSLLETWSGAGEVILIDAIVTRRRRGEVSVWDALARPARLPLPNSSHALGLADAIALAEMLGWLPARLTLYGIEARSFELGRMPSKSVLRGVEEAARRIHEYCAHQRRTAF